MSGVSPSPLRTLSQRTRCVDATATTVSSQRAALAFVCDANAVRMWWSDADCKEVSYLLAFTSAPASRRHWTISRLRRAAFSGDTYKIIHKRTWCHVRRQHSTMSGVSPSPLRTLSQRTRCVHATATTVSSHRAALAFVCDAKAVTVRWSDGGCKGASYLPALTSAPALRRHSAISSLPRGASSGATYARM